MLTRIKDWCRYYDDELRAMFYFVVSATVFITVIVSFLLFAQANSLKYNCDLDTKPSLHTAAWIDDSQFAYDPKGFCERLVKEMSNGH